MTVPAEISPSARGDLEGVAVDASGDRAGGRSARSAQPVHEPSLVIEAGRAERHYWRDLWRYRELFVILAWRDLAVRYKQTVFGVAWAVIRPLLTMVVFTVLFSRVAKLPSAGATPYPIMVFAGMLPWYLFSSIFSDASNSLINNAALIGKVYFPRIIIPSATIAVALTDFAVSFLIMIPLMIWYHFMPDWRVIFLPVFVVLAILASLGPALLISTLNIRYRDFRYVVPFILQFGIYVSPVGFSSSVVPHKWQLLYSLNPMVGVIEGFRWSLLGGQANPIWPAIVMSVVVSAFTLWLGVVFFRKTERSFADLI